MAKRKSRAERKQHRTRRDNAAERGLPQATPLTPPSATFVASAPSVASTLRKERIQAQNATRNSGALWLRVGLVAVFVLGVVLVVSRMRQSQVESSDLARSTSSASPQATNGPGDDASVTSPAPAVSAQEETSEPTLEAAEAIPAAEPVPTLQPSELAEPDKSAEALARPTAAPTSSVTRISQPAAPPTGRAAESAHTVAPQPAPATAPAPAAPVAPIAPLLPKGPVTPTQPASPVAPVAPLAPAAPGQP